MQLLKLKIDIQKPVWLIDVPEECVALFDGMARFNARGKVRPEQIVFFAEDKAALDEMFEAVAARMQDDALFWIAYPKQSGNKQSDLIRNAGWQTVFDTGYRIVASASINENWSVVRIRKHDLNANYTSNVPMAERKTPGIDYVKRTAALPKDAIAVLENFSGLTAIFNSMSFTHKREYIEAIEDAKKPETRQRRIEKMADALLKMQQ